MGHFLLLLAWNILVLVLVVYMSVLRESLILLVHFYVNLRVLLSATTGSPSIYDLLRHGSRSTGFAKGIHHI